MPSSESSDKRQAAREVIDILHEISLLLVRFSPLYSFLILYRELICFYQNTNLNRTELSLCVSLIENGINPDALAVNS